jgi:predicted nucleic acid-binding protein
MELPLQITWRNLDRSPAVEADIRTRAEKLNEFHDRIVSCRVVVEASHRHHHKGNLFRVRIDVKVPERELVITRDPADDQVLVAALAAQADLIVSGDAHLLDLKSFMGIEIITALQAATRLGATGKT